MDVMGGKITINLREQH